MKKQRASTGNKKAFKWSLIAVGIGLLYWMRLKTSLPTSPAQPTSSTKSNAVRDQIIKLLTLNGYSQRMAQNWFLVANMETAGFTSRLFREDNNPWGMKQPSIRVTKSIGAGASGFARYYNLDDAIIDLVFYMEEFSYPNDFASLDAQLKFMKSKGYFEEPLSTYTGLVKAWAQKTGYAT